MARKDWVWMPHPGHFIGSRDCRFVLNTYLGNGYLVSTVGEYWPDATVRRIHAEIHDPDWWEHNKGLKGDQFDAAYMGQFGFQEIGLDRTYETMVFRAIPSTQDCCPFEQADGSNKDAEWYNDAGAALEGHLAMCKRWSRKRK